FHGGELLSYYALLSKMINHIPTVFTFTFIPSLYRRAYQWPTRSSLAAVSMSRIPKMVRASKLDHVIALTEYARRRLATDELIPKTKLYLIRYGLTQTYLDRSHDRGQS